MFFLKFCSRLKHKQPLFYHSFYTYETFQQAGLHSYLLSALKRNKITKPTSIQSQSLSVLAEGDNAIITAETGSGKTFCYLLPIMNQILKEKELQVKETKLNSLNGAVILVPTKELCAQVQQVAHLLDIQKKIEIKRTGSLAFTASIEQKNEIESKEQQEKEKPQQQISKKGKKEQINKFVNENVIKSINWKEVDILIATPTQLSQMLAVKDKSNPYDFNPKFLVIDEFDLLLGDTNIAKSTIEIINRFQKSLKQQKLPQSFIQIILAGASFPIKIQRENALAYLKKILHHPTIIESQNFYKICPKMKHNIVKVEETLANNPGITQLDILIRIVSKSTSKRMMVFCDSAETVEQVSKALIEQRISSLPFHSQLTGEQRIQAIKEFDSEAIKVLVSTDLGCRGLDFYAVDHVIQYNFALDSISFLHRVGRTCRMEREGTVTSFLKESNIFLFQQINQIISQNQRFDPIVSRKRSLSKNHKRTTESDDSDQE